MANYKKAFLAEQGKVRNRDARILELEKDLAVQKGIADRLSECLHKLLMHGRVEINIAEDKTSTAIHDLERIIS